VARIASAVKNNRKNRRRRDINRARRSALRTSIKKMRQLIEKDGEAARKAVSHAMSTLDRAVSKGVLHRNAAARHKSRMMKRLQGLAKAG
jgi:small subunit ribosomal protein S20